MDWNKILNKKDNSTISNNPPAPKDLEDKYSGYASNYSDSNFKEKLKAEGKRLGNKVIANSKFLYLLATDKDSPLPLTYRSVIFGALGYLILPIDLIPDFLPVGYTDDLAAIMAVIGAVTKLAKEIKDPEWLDKYNKIRQKAGLPIEVESETKEED